MKIKDIEKILKSEREAENIPDVYASAKKAPLNKLLSGETPARAFQKQVVMRLLVTALILFAVAAVCIGAMWLSKPASPTIPDCNVEVKVISGGVPTVYSIVVKNEFDIASVLKSDGKDAQEGNAEVIAPCDIEDFIVLKDGDEVFIMSKSADFDRALRVANRVLADLRYAYGDIFSAFEIGVEGE